MRVPCITTTLTSGDRRVSHGGASFSTRLTVQHAQMSEAFFAVLLIDISFSMKWDHGQGPYKQLSLHFCQNNELHGKITLITVAPKVTPVSFTRHLNVSMKSSKS